MKYNHAVKYNGVFYQTGTDVPVEDKKDDAGANENLVDNEDKGEKESTETDTNEKATKKK